MTPREEAWHKERTGLITSSCLKKLMTKGRKSSWGDTSISYLYEKLYERRTGRPIRGESNKNFEFGKTQEPSAIAWLRANTMYFIKHCSSEEDFPEKIEFRTGIIKGFGDSSDFLVYENEQSDPSTPLAVGEIKCVVKQGKFEKLRRTTRAQALMEYREQFIGHLISYPSAQYLLYVIYDGQDVDDDFDLGDPTATDRGIIFRYERSELEGAFDEFEERILEADSALDEALETDECLERILNG